MLFAGDISHVYRVERHSRVFVPLMASMASCGFPSPADDYMEGPLNFNELLIANLAATFAVRAVGDSMIDVGIFPKDIVVVDRSMTAVDHSIVLALLDGDFTIKRYRQKDNRVWLQAENPAYADIVLTEDNEFQVWGVVTRSIRILA